MIDQTVLLAHLNTFIDPITQQGLVRSNRISGLIIKGGHISFALISAPQYRSTYEDLAKQLEKSVKSMENVKSCHVLLTQERPSPNQLPPLERLKEIIVVGSGKGGVGKSTVALNLSLGLVKKGLRVGLLDADIYGPSIPTMLDIHDSPESHKQKIIPLQTKGLKVLSIGFLISEHASVVWRGPLIQKALVQMLWGAEWGDLDVLVIDLPPGTGDVQITLCQKVQLSGAIVVSTPQDLALIDARKAVDMFQKVNVPLLGIIENMSQFTCPHCGHNSPIFDHDGARQEAEKLKIPFLGSLPLSIDIRKNKIQQDLFIPLTEQIYRKLEGSGNIIFSH